jgi:uncharacterized membrane-anchored protein YitT (DUF2179 family)
MKAELRKNKKFKILKKYIIIFAGSILMALSVNLVFEPIGLVTGGVSGLAIVIKYLTEPFIDGGVPVWLFNVVINVPLFIIAIALKGKKYIFTVLAGAIAFSVALYIIPVYDLQLENKLLASIFGGVAGGAGIGLVFSMSSSTGGTDLLAMLIHDHKKYISAPQLLIVIDGLIILAGAMVFGISNAFYALIAVYITAKVSDGILEGLKYAKMAYIISEEYEKIAEAILKNMDRGVTGLNATGMYSNNARKMLFCVVSKKEIVKIKEIAQEIDSKSFIIISDVREVMGEGFIEYRQ